MFIRYPANLKIHHKDYMNKYISLIKLKSLVIEVIRKMHTNSTFTDDILYSKTVYSESYGIHIKPLKIFFNKHLNRCKDKLDFLEKYRIKIYYNNYYGVFNVYDWKFENTSNSTDNKIIDKLWSKIKHYLKINLRIAKFNLEYT